jgi:hypothetical protein
MSTISKHVYTYKLQAEHFNKKSVNIAFVSTTVSTPQHQSYQNITGTPSMQGTSGSVQQNWKKIQSFVNDTMLNWENFLPSLALSYNTSYHSTIALTPFKLLFVEKARLPSFPNVDIQKIHYSETSATERFNLLQKLRKRAFTCWGLLLVYMYRWRDFGQNKLLL